jgi:hypothetical protein
MIRRVGALTVAGVFVALALPAVAAARTACPQTHVVARSAKAVVFARTAHDDVGTTVYYGCLLRVKKVYRLTQLGDWGLNEVHPRFIRLAGRYVAYEQDWGSGAGGASNTVSVRDLSTGVVIHQAYVSRDGGDDGDYAESIVLKRSGSVAWTAHTYDAHDNPTHEVRAMTPGTRTGHAGVDIDHPRLLDVGPNVVPGSLRLSANGSSVSWVKAGRRHSAALR